MTTRTFTNRAELMIALLKDERWEHNAIVCYYDKSRKIGDSFRADSDGVTELISSFWELCDGKTLWHKVEEKTELDLMKEKYASGDYIIICKNPKPIANQTSTWFLHQESHLGAYKPFEADHLQHKLIHKNHKDILNAYLADNSVSITWGLGGVVLTGEAFIEEYDESFEYRLKLKKKIIQLAMFTCYDSDRKIWEDITICENLDEYKIKLFATYFTNHHEIPNTRYEQEIEE